MSSSEEEYEPSGDDEKGQSSGSESTGSSSSASASASSNSARGTAKRRVIAKKTSKDKGADDDDYDDDDDDDKKKKKKKRVIKVARPKGKPARSTASVTDQSDSEEEEWSAGSTKKEQENSTLPSSSSEEDYQEALKRRRSSAKRAAIPRRRRLVKTSKRKPKDSSDDSSSEVDALLTPSRRPQRQAANSAKKYLVDSKGSDSERDTFGKDSNSDASRGAEKQTFETPPPRRPRRVAATSASKKLIDSRGSESEQDESDEAKEVVVVKETSKPKTKSQHSKKTSNGQVKGRALHASDIDSSCSSSDSSDSDDSGQASTSIRTRQAYMETRRIPWDSEEEEEEENLALLTMEQHNCMGLEAVTRKPLSHPHLVWGSRFANGGWQTMCYEIETVNILSKLRGYWAEPPTFLAPMSSNFAEQIQNKFDVDVTKVSPEDFKLKARPTHVMVQSRKLNKAVEYDYEALLNDEQHRNMRKGDLYVCPVCYEFCLDERDNDKDDIDGSSGGKDGNENGQERVLDHHKDMPDPLEMLQANDDYEGAALMCFETQAALRAHLKSAHHVLDSKSRALSQLLFQYKLRGEDGLAQRFVANMPEEKRANGAWAYRYWKEVPWRCTVFNHLMSIVKRIQRAGPKARRMTTFPPRKNQKSSRKVWNDIMAALGNSEEADNNFVVRDGEEEAAEASQIESVQPSFLHDDPESDENDELVKKITEKYAAIEKINRARRSHQIYQGEEDGLEDEDGFLYISSGSKSKAKSKPAKKPKRKRLKKTKPRAKVTPAAAQVGESSSDDDAEIKPKRLKKSQSQGNRKRRSFSSSSSSSEDEEDAEEDDAAGSASSTSSSSDSEGEALLSQRNGANSGLRMKRKAAVVVVDDDDDDDDGGGDGNKNQKRLKKANPSKKLEFGTKSDSDSSEWDVTSIT